MIPVPLLIETLVYICFVMDYSSEKKIDSYYTVWFYIHFHSDDYEHMFYMYGHVPEKYHDYEIYHMHNIFIIKVGLLDKLWL